MMMPPSVNAMYRALGRRVILSKPGRDFFRVTIPAIKYQANGWRTSGRVAVLVRLYFPDRRRCDIDNRIKGCQDALTKAGIWADDVQVDDLRVLRMPVDKLNPRCDVEVTIL